MPSHPSTQLSLRRAVFWLCALLVSVPWLSSCGSGKDGGTRPGIRTVRFEPGSADTTLGTLQTLRIRAIREDGVEVPARFTVNGAADTTATVWDFVPPVEGQYVLDAVSTVDGVDYSAHWTVSVSDAIVPPTPAVQVPSAVEGAIPGSIELQWNAPPATQVPVPIVEYVLGFATAPFDSTQFADVDQMTVPHDPRAIVQRARLEGLVERAVYSVRIAVRDALGRLSALSPPVERESTGHFDVTGVVTWLDIGLPQRPLANVLVDIGGVKAFTDVAGSYALRNLPDLGMHPLIAREQSGSNYYTYQTSPAPPVSRVESFVLFQQDIIEIQPSTPGVDPAISRLEYFRRLTNNFSGPTYTTHPWPSLPIPIYLGDYISPNGHSYRSVFREAMRRWNALGDSLLRPVDLDVDPATDPTRTGARFVADLPVVGGGLLGEVRVVRPFGGQLYETQPEFLDVHMRVDFPSIELAIVVATHELGHVLGLTHSPDGADIMTAGVGVGGSLADNSPKAKERFAVRLLHAIPAGTDLRNYGREVAP